MDKVCRPMLIVEGQGDAAAVPILIRRILAEHEIHHIQLVPRPKTNVSVQILMRAGEVERYSAYCARDPSCDSVIIAVDCEDVDPELAYTSICGRVLNVHHAKPTAIALFRREFEVIFLPSIELIKSSYPEFRWGHVKVPTHPENIRGVKEHISAMMSNDKAYKETRDQPRFSSKVDLNLARSVSSFRAFESALLWLIDQCAGSKGVFPGAERT